MIIEPNIEIVPEQYAFLGPYYWVIVWKGLWKAEYFLLDFLELVVRRGFRWSFVGLLVFLYDGFGWLVWWAGTDIVLFLDLILGLDF